MAQRLVRTLCPHCKTPTELDAEQWAEFCQGVDIELTQPHKAEGCLECRQTGFLGRVGLYEMFEMSESVKQIVKPEMAISDLRKKATSEGLETLRINGAKKVAAGLTTMEEVMRVTPFVER